MNMLVFLFCYLFSILLIMAVYACLNKLDIHMNGFIDAMFQFIPPAGVGIFIVVEIAWFLQILLLKTIHFFKHFF